MSSNILKCHNPFEKLKEKADFEWISKYAKVGFGDCLHHMNQIEDETIDLIITDPPYNIGKFMHSRNTNIGKMRSNHFAYAGWDNLDYEEWLENMDKFFEHAGRVLRKKGSLILFMSLIKIETIIDLADKHGFYYKTVGIWHKTNPMPRNMNLQFVNSTEAWVYFINKGTTGTFNNENKLIHDFFETSLTSKKEKSHGKHPTQKPEALISTFVTLLSNKNEIVLDPFMGSGTTGIACEKNKRYFIGIELNKDYYLTATNRIKEVSLVKT